MAAGRRCISCPRIIPAGSYRGRCRDCLRRWDADRGTKTQRGYGSIVLTTPLGTMTYDQCRAAYRAMLDDGAVLRCARCGGLVRGAFHLDHSPDRLAVIGPSHPTCNTSAAGKAARQAST